MQGQSEGGIILGVLNYNPLCLCISQIQIPHVHNLRQYKEVARERKK